MKDLKVAQQQMVSIAQALSVDASVLIMDEPTAALTNTEIDELFRIIRTLKSQGVGVVHISIASRSCARSPIASRSCVTGVTWPRWRRRPPPSTTSSR